MAVGGWFHLAQPVRRGPQGKVPASGDWWNMDLSLKTIPQESYTQTNDVSGRPHTSKYHYVAQRIPGLVEGYALIRRSGLESLHAWITDMCYDLLILQVVFRKQANRMLWELLGRR